MLDSLYELIRFIGGFILFAFVAIIGIATIYLAMTLPFIKFEESNNALWLLLYLIVLPTLFWAIYKLNDE